MLSGPLRRRESPASVVLQSITEPCVILINDVTSHSSLLWVYRLRRPFLELGHKVRKDLPSRLSLLANFNKDYLC